MPCNLSAPGLTRRRLLLGLAAATALAGCRPESPAAPGDLPFSLLSPDATRALRGLSTADARSVLTQADRLTQIPPAPSRLVHTEHGYAGQPAYDAGVQAKTQWSAVLTLGLAAAIGGNGHHLQATVALLESWAEVYQPSLNPIDEEGLDDLMLAADLIRPLHPLPQFSEFLARIADGYRQAQQDSTQRPLRDSDRNNWNAHRLKLATLAAYGTGSRERIAALPALRDRHLARAIAADGKVIDFRQRDALHYVVYALHPLCMACLSSRAHGDIWLNRTQPGSGSLRMALHWLRPYVRGEKTHDEFAATTVPFDRERAAAGVKGFQGQWDRRGAVPLMALAARLAPDEFSADAEALQQQTATRPPAWLRLTRAG